MESISGISSPEKVAELRGRVNLSLPGILALAGHCQ